MKNRLTLYGFINSLLRPFFLESHALPLDLFRVSSGTVILAYFILLFFQTSGIIGTSGALDGDIIQELFPGANLTPLRADFPLPVFYAVWSLAIISALCLIIGYRSRFFAAVVFIICIFTSRAIFPVTYLDDYWLTSTAFWLILLPIGQTLTLSQEVFRERSVFSKWARQKVAGVTTRLYIVHLFTLYLNHDLWSPDRITGWLSKGNNILLWVAVIMVALGRFTKASRYIWPLFICLHLYLLYFTSTKLTILALLSSGFLIFEKSFWSALARVGQAQTRLKLSLFRTPSAVATGYLFFSLLFFASKMDDLRFFRPVSAKVLSDVGLLPTAQVVSISRVKFLSSLSDDKNNESRNDFTTFDGFWPRGIRTQLLVDYFANISRSDLPERKRFKLKGSMMKRTAERFCAKYPNAKDPITLLAERSNDSSSIQSADRKTNVRLRFECDRSKQGARILPIKKIKDASLASANSRYFDPPIEFPVGLKRKSYLGTEACSGCHPEQRRSWAGTPHSRSLSVPSLSSVLGDFNGSRLDLPDGVITMTTESGGYFFYLKNSESIERHRVELVLASGRQQQAYITKGKDNRYKLLPAIWSIQGRHWLPLALFYPDAFRRSRSIYYQLPDVNEAGCFDCHASQVTQTVVSNGLMTRWVDLGVNCESCHGPSRLHFYNHRNGLPDSSVINFSKLESEDAVRRCGRCHSNHALYRDYSTDVEAERDFPTLLDTPALRADGTQHLPSGQYAGFVLSRCFEKGRATCTICHPSHTGPDKNRNSEPAPTELYNRRCIICHKAFRDDKTVKYHTHHKSAIPCTDCHMPAIWLRNEPRMVKKAVDHSISIPRPAENDMINRDNACYSCHKDYSTETVFSILESWQSNRTVKIRPWVRSIWSARRDELNSVQPLLDILKNKRSKKLLVASALRFLEMENQYPLTVESIKHFTEEKITEVRTSALNALITHDPANRSQWRSVAKTDKSALVRIFTFRSQIDPIAMNELEIRRFQYDVLCLSLRPPIHDLMFLADMRDARQEPFEALALLDLALHYSRPTKPPAILDAKKVLLNKWGLSLSDK